MGTLQEYVMAGFMTLMGANETTLRLPAAIFFAAAVFVIHNTISREISREVALASGILMVVGNSALVTYSAFNIPDYAATTFLAAGIAWQTFRVDRSRTLAQWILLGALAGFGAYLHQILVLQTMASLAFLATRSILSSRLSPMGRDRAFWTLVACGLAAVILLLPVAYYYLTRRATYAASPLDLVLLSGGLVFAGVFVVQLMRVLRPSQADLLAIGSFAIAFAAFQAPPNLWFKYQELPSLLTDHVPLWQAGSYSLKHAHEWVTVQPGLLFNYVLPQIAIGRMESISGTGSISGPFPIDAVGMFSAAGLLVFVALLVRHFQLGKRPMLASPETVFILPLLLLVLALFPSWRLFGPSSYRYLLPFLPGLYLGAVLAIQSITTSRRILFGLVGAYALYGAYDCLATRPQFIPPDQGCVAIAARLLEREIDGALVSGKCTEELAWRAAGRFWVADVNYRENVRFLYPRPSRIATAESIAAVNVDDATRERLFGSSAGEFASAETLSPGVVIYRRKPLI
jgi:hypothetical protein